MEVDTSVQQPTDLFERHDFILNSIQSRIESIALNSESNHEQDASNLYEHAQKVLEESSDNGTDISDLLSTALKKSIVHVLKGNLTKSTDEAFDTAIRIVQMSIHLAKQQKPQNSNEKCVSDKIPLTLLEYLFTFHQQSDLLRRIDSIRDCFNQFNPRVPEKLGLSPRSVIWAVKLVVCCLNRDRSYLNPVLSARMCLMLAASMSTWHMSGMNKRGLCNTEKRFDYERALKEEQNSDVDVSLYRSFWRIQEFMLDPSTVDTTIAWKHAIESMRKVLEAFEVIPKTEPKSDYTGQVPHYFTSPSLLQLQLSDARLRQHVLLQFVIFLHYLESFGEMSASNTKDASAKGQKGELYRSLFSDTGEGNQMQARVLSLLEKDSSVQFRRFIASIFVRERRWMYWKEKTGWSHLQPKMRKEPAKKFIRRSRDSDGNDMPPAKRARGRNSWLERQKGWEQMPRNPTDPLKEEGCVVPGTKDILDEVKEDVDDDDITEDFKRKNDSKYVWKTMRILSDEGTGLLLKAVDNKAKLGHDLELCLPSVETVETTDLSKEEMNGSAKETATAS